MTTYKLGPVKPHVAEAANVVGNAYGLKTIYGFGSGGELGLASDHPWGRALDLMTNNIANGKAVGDAIANYFVQNAEQWNVKYIIWWHRIWERGRGWSPYSGTKNPHTDHVHVSFYDKAGVGVPGKPGGAGGFAQGVVDGVTDTVVPDWAQGLVGVARDINAAAAWLTNADNWVRIGLFGGGLVLVLVALIGVPTVQTVSHLAGKVVKR